mmetsp:Transcript_10987/g.45578  ORF Transcript_10987/g.45578 Transcript_10987/m.45578 type:complete len:339 (+) Transcript_10987:963-1979(+)
MLGVFMSLWKILRECRYDMPLAASRASFNLRPTLCAILSWKLAGAPGGRDGLAAAARATLRTSWRLLCAQSSVTTNKPSSAPTPKNRTRLAWRRCLSMDTSALTCCCCSSVSDRSELASTFTATGECMCVALNTTPPEPSPIFVQGCGSSAIGISHCSLSDESKLSERKLLALGLACMPSCCRSSASASCMRVRAAPSAPASALPPGPSAAAAAAPDEVAAATGVITSRAAPPTRGDPPTSRSSPLRSSTSCLRPGSMLATSRVASRVSAKVSSASSNCSQRSSESCSTSQQRHSHAQASTAESAPAPPSTATTSGARRAKERIARPMHAARRPPWRL